MAKLTIGKLAKMSGVGIETIRYYQQKELLREPKTSGAVRTYSEEDAQRVIFIKKVQGLGFSLAEVKELLELNTKPRMTCGTVKKKTTEKLREIEKKISDLQQMKKSLEKLSNACDSSQDSYKQYKVEDCFDFGLNCNCLEDL